MPFTLLGAMCWIEIDAAYYPYMQVLQVCFLGYVRCSGRTNPYCGISINEANTIDAQGSNDVEIRSAISSAKAIGPALAEGITRSPGPATSALWVAGGSGVLVRLTC